MGLKFLLSYLCSIASLCLQAQTITGKLVDGKTGQSIPLGNLALAAQDLSSQIKYALSDTAGIFEFRETPHGKYVLSASCIGYKNIQKEILLNENGTNILNLGTILMTEDISLLKEVTVKGERPNFEIRNGQVKIGVAGNPFFKADASLLDVFRKLLGLQINPDGTMLLASRATPTLFVDGKPVNMNRDEIRVYLSSLSPDMIESVEQINQPSSKYDGEYQGIIDVKLKRNQALGLRGSYNIRFQRNLYSLLDNTLALTFKTNSFVYDLNLGQTTGSTFYKYHALQYLSDSNAMTTDTRTITFNRNLNIQARVGYQILKGHNLEAYVRTYQIGRNAVTGNQLITQTYDFAKTVSAITSENNALPKQHNYSGGLNYDVSFKNSELHVATALAQIDNRQTEDIQNRKVPGNQLTDYWKTIARNNVMIRAAQADYTQNIKRGKLEFGGKFAYTTTRNNLRYDTLSNDVFIPDPRRSNLFRYQERIAAAYFSYSGHRDKFNYSLSITTEQTSNLANSITDAAVTEKKYLKWLPSLNFTNEIENSHQLAFTYSRRLTRPTFEALNPFRFYLSPRNYWIGNPYLQPSTTELFSLSYTIRNFHASLNAGREKDPMVRYPEYDPVTNILAYLGTNLPYRNFANIQASMPLTVRKWWRVNNNIGLYFNRELRPYLG
ncbi:hypothetical protein DYBT9275_00972 [Dyadobacter sp. CECT 9275]|uniref:Outer membrane protein beta-barrel domain-containing protein n=1 Tax=Dyadobacter helix TaxID=2822344 RepID=A0A916JAE4_9BACT|nr:hypothetical protein DYBT9275_00972 [Dyadobacter sp. CECT 9275]